LQLPPTASELPQVFVSEKLVELVPVMPMLLKVTALAPVFVTVMDCAVVVVKLSELGETVTVGVLFATAVPVSEATCVVPLMSPELSVTIRDAARAPVAVGVKFTLTLQVLFAATELPQVFVSEKSPALVPLIAIEAIVSVAVPVLPKMSVCTPEEALTAVVEKVSAPGDGWKSVCGAAAVPIRSMVCGELTALSAMLTWPV